MPAASYLELDPPAPQLADERQNIVYFSLRRFIERRRRSGPGRLGPEESAQVVLEMQPGAQRVAELSIVYRGLAGFRIQLQSLIPVFFNPIAAVHHYSSMASAAFAARGESGDINTKKLFYALRALLACRWIERHSSQPPTEFDRLVATVASEDERRWIANLLEQKVAGREADQAVDTRRRLDPMMGELTSLKSYSTRAPHPAKSDPNLLDPILRQWTI